jgi:hypothetical protein
MTIPMRIAYIAHPIGSDVEANLASLRQIIKEINNTEPFVIPFCPYYADVVSIGDDDPISRARGLRNALCLLIRHGLVDELRLYGSGITKGMREEVLIAINMEIPIICPLPSQLYNDLAAIFIEVGAHNYMPIKS